jgi:radical SAM superfamily enzyme YgiQ (UPF0313 family)
MPLNVLAVHPPYPGKREIVYVPLGLGYIISTIEREGHTVKTLDMHNLGLTMDVVEQELRRGDYDLCIMGGFAMQVAGMKAVTDLVREVSPKTLVVVGGVGVSDIPEIVLDYIGADAVATGECEAVLPQMMDSIAAGHPFEKVPTFFYRHKGNIVRNLKGPVVEDLDTLAYPAYHHFDIDYIAPRSYNGEGFRSIHAMTSRGCPFRCNFCINSVINDSKFQKQLYGGLTDERKKASQRFRSPASMVKELTHLRDTYGINDFHFADEEFITHRSRVFEICDALRPLGITWSTSGRADWATTDKLGAMRDAGCRYVLFGVETGSQKLMTDMDKSAKREKVIDGLNAARSTGMNFIANFMIGHPAETKETVEETIEFCREMELTFLPSYVVLFPNSRMFHENKDKIKGWKWYFDKLTQLDFTRRVFINLTKMPDRELVRLRNRAVSHSIAYKIVGKDRIALARSLAPLIAFALMLVEASPSKVRWVVRNFARMLFDLKSSKAKQVAPFNLGVSPVLATDDGYEVSLKELERQPYKELERQSHR